MSEPQGQIAGRLSVVVSASLKGFRKELERKVEAASEGVKAEVGVKIVAKKLRKELQSKVDEAAAGVMAKVGIDLDSGTLKAKVEAAAKAAGANATVGVDADSDGLSEKVQAAALEAQAATPDVKVGVRARIKDVIADVFKARAEASAAANAGGPVEIPVKAKVSGGGFKMPRGLIRGGLIAGIVSLVEPAVGAIGQVVAGLTAMTGAAAPALGTISAFPIAIATFVQSMAAGKIATQGVGDAMGLLAQKQAALARGEKLTTAENEKLKQSLSELSPSAILFAKNTVGLRKEWVKARKAIQEPLFKPLAKEIRPLAMSLLPTLTKGLSGTTKVMGQNLATTAQFLQTRGAQSDIGKVMSNNNTILGDFLYTMGQFGQGSLDFLVSSRKFGRGVGDTMRSVGDWFADKAANGRKTGSTEAFLDRASAKAKQLWSILSNIGSGLKGIFDAGVGSGDRLLHMFDKFTGNWAQWVNSTAGQNYLKDWFDGAESGFIEFSRLINDTFKGIAKWANDPKIAGMLKTIRTELGPALGDFLKSLSDAAGENFLNLLTELTRLLNNLEPAIAIVTQLTAAIVALLAAINDLAAAHPGEANIVATIIGGLVVAGSIGKLGKITGALLGLGKASKGLKAAGAGAEVAAGGLGKLGKLGSVFGKFSKLPVLKKAGIVGLALQGIDLARQIKEAHDYGGKLSEGLTTGFSDGIDNARSRKAMDDAWSNAFKDQNHSWYNPDLLGDDVAKWIDKLGVDQDRLKTEIGKFGTTGDYYKQVMGKLKDGFGKNPIGILPGVNTDNEMADKVRNQIEEIGQAADKAIADLKKHRASRSNLAELLLGPIGEAPSQQINAWVDKATKGFQSAVKKASSGRFDDVDQIAPKGPTNTNLQGPQSILSQARGAMHGAVGKNPFAAWSKQKIKAPKLPAPKMQTKDLATLGRKAGKSFSDALSKSAKGKKIKPPKIDTKGLSRDGRKAGKSFSDSMQKATKGKKIKAPKIDTSAAKKSVRELANVTGKSLNQVGQKVAKGTGQASRTARKNFAQIPQAARKSFKSTSDAADKSMTSVVRAIRSKVGPAKAGASAVANGTKAPFTALRGPLSAAGSNAMAGFTAGIRAEGANAVAAARSIAAQVAAATRSELDIHSPSRVMAKLGHWVSAGFAKGIMGGLKAVRKAEAGLWDRLRSRKIAGERIAALKRQYAHEFKVLEDAARRRERLGDRIDRIQNRVNRLKEGRSAVKSALKSSGEEFGSVAAIASANGGLAAPGFLLSQLRDRAAKSKKFRKIINRLRKRGLGKNAIRQIIELGMEDGLPVAQQLMSSTPEQLKKINRLQAVIRKEAKKLGQETAKGFYNAGIKAGQGMLSALRKKQKQLNKIAEHMAHALVNEIRREFGLKVKKKSDPKKKGDGKNKKKKKGGSGRGPAPKMSQIPAAARKANNDSGGNRKRHAQKAAAARLEESRAHASAKAMPATHASAAKAPLVGELRIDGLKGKDLRDALDETYFTLRRISHGGLYADRTA